MTTQSQYYTQTPNFVSATQGEVDPRTGLFSLSMPIANLIGNNNLGPALPLTLSYGPLSTTDLYGFGIGCSLGLSSFDVHNNLLTLSTGEQYPTQGYGSSVKILQKRLDSFTFSCLSPETSPGGKNTYQITYKSGQIELLQLVGDNIYLPLYIYTPAGHGLKLTWKCVQGQLLLQNINDDQGPLCTLAYSASVKITVWPGTLEEYEIQFEFLDGQISKLINLAESKQPLEWDFSFQPVRVGSTSYTLLTKVRAPTGYLQDISYNNQLDFPMQAGGLQALPAVSQYVQTPGFGQPKLITQYSFTPHNYLGSGGDLASWSPTLDYFYNNNMTNYQYGSEQSSYAEDGSLLATTTRTYNSYHLLITELSTQGTCSRETQIAYYAKLATAYDDQVPQCLSPYQQQVTYTDTSKPKGRQTRQEFTSTTYDDSGNILVQATSSYPVLTLDGKCAPQWIATPDGAVTTYVYYDPAGEKDCCPPEPNGFTRFIKTQTVTPAPTQYKDTPTTVASYTYQTLSKPYMGNQQNVIQSVVVALNESHFTNVTFNQDGSIKDSTQLSSKTTTYVDEPNSPEHGRVKHVAGTIYDLNDGTPYTSTIDLTFNVQAASKTEPTALVQTAAFTGFDGCYIQIGKSQSCMSGRTLSVTDRYNNVTSYTYDLLGRILTKTLNSTSDTYKSTTTTSYTLTTTPAPDPRNPPVVTEISTTVTDDHGNAVRTCHDGMGRTIEQWTNDMDAGASDTGYQTQTQTYDNLGRSLVSTAWDYMRKQPGVLADTTPSATSATTLSYNDWGQNHLTTLNTECEAHSDYDPIQLMHSAYTCSYTQQGKVPAATILGKQQVLQDIATFTSTTTHLDSEGTAYGSQIGMFDGLKRLRHMADELNNVTTYTYDAFGRVSTTTLPDNSVVTKTYAPHSKAALITGITVLDGVTGRLYDLGCQEFDSLHRLKSTTSGGIVTTVGGKSTRTGGRTYTYDYTVDGEPTCNAQPTTVTTPNKEVINYTYVPELSNAVNTVNVGDLKQTLEYYSNTDTVSAGAIPGAPPHMPKATGALKSATEAGGMVLQMDYYQSGQLSAETFTPVQQSAKTVSGAAQKSTAYTYSLLGRAQFYTDVGQVQQIYTYNPDGSAHSILDPNLTVELAYDPIGRFKSQKVTDLTSNHSLTTEITLNDFNQEIRRDFYENDSPKPTMSITQHYYNNGQRKSRTTFKPDDAANPLRDEAYIYDSRNRLKTYTCSGSALPEDAYGKPIQKQEFTYDALSNILTCKTTFDGGDDTTTFHYDGNQYDPTQLTLVTHSNPEAGYPAKIDLSHAYDANGRMITDEEGRKLTYDGLGRLQTITDADNIPRQYLYDALDTLVGQVVSDTDTRELYYRSNILVNEISSSTNQNTRFIKMGNSCVGQVTE